MPTPNRNILDAYYSVGANAILSNGLAISDSDKCSKCKFKTKDRKKFIAHINKFHPPQAPKEWICKHKRLRFECEKCLKVLLKEPPEFLIHPELIRHSNLLKKVPKGLKDESSW